MAECDDSVTTATTATFTRISEWRYAELRKAEADLAAATARVAGYALLVGELIGHLVVVTDLGSAGGGWADWACLICRATWFGAADAPPQIVHAPDCILAADPEVGAVSLSAFVRASIAWAKDRGYLDPEYADEDYPGDALWTAMVDALRAVAQKENAP